MKLKLYSIVMLLSFLTAIGHDAIPHHHHELVDEFHDHHNHDFHHGDDHSHHEFDTHITHQQHDCCTDHTLPISHEHIAELEDLTIARLSSIKDVTVAPVIIKSILSAFAGNKDILSRYLETVFYTADHPLGTDLDLTSAISLRAPPAIPFRNL